MQLPQYYISNHMHEELCAKAATKIWAAMHKVHVNIYWTCTRYVTTIIVYI